MKKASAKETKKETKKSCNLCGCTIHNKGSYAEPTVKGRSHATKHHCVAERFFGRSKTSKNEERVIIFHSCPWGMEEKVIEFCYECHEMLLHNPVLLPKEITAFSELVKKRGLNEQKKPRDKKLIAKRIQLFHEIIMKGLKSFKA